jgi:IS5 family transposase
MKVYVSVDCGSGLVHSASVTVASGQQLPNLLHDKETRMYGDSAYRNQKKVLK